MIVVWAAVSSFVGATFGAIFVEWYRQKNRLRLAAIDKRLEVYQEAFALLSGVANTMDAADVSLVELADKCEAWWLENCLYLDAKAGKAFRGAYVDVLACAFAPPSSHQEEVERTQQRVGDVCNTVAKGVGLPIIVEEKLNLVKRGRRSKEG